MTIDPDGSTPVYQQVAAIIRDRIASGELRPDRPVPSIVQIVQEFGVARGTAIKALAVLHDEGLTVKVPGRGTYVKPPASEETGGMAGGQTT